MAAAVGLRLAQGGGLRGGDVTRTEAVALDVVLSVLRADVARQHLQPALGGSVGRDRLAPQLGHHGADVDNLAMPLLHHGGQHGLRADESARQVHVNDAAELGSVHLVHGDAADDAGVVHQNIHRAQRACNVLHHSPDSKLVGHVAKITVRLDAQLGILGHGAVAVFFTGAVEADGCAYLGVSGGNGKADAVGSARHQGHFPVEGEIQIRVHKVVVYVHGRKDKGSLRKNKRRKGIQAEFYHISRHAFPIW